MIIKNKILFLFTICFFAFYNAKSQCIVEDILVTSPPPMSDPFTGGNPTYFPGQVIEFCYTIENYDGGLAENNNNWMHGVVPLFGPGWDQTTLIPVGQPEPVNDLDGEWIWTDNVVGENSGNLVVNPGWWFDAASGGGALNGNPGDNYGDGGGGSWTFCWQITVKECPPADNGASLVMEITNYSDSETGSYTQEGCVDDSSLFFYANLNCPTCDETELIIVEPTCETPEGLAFVTPDGEGPWNLTWMDPFGNVIVANNNIIGPFSLTGLEPNDYYLIVEDTFDDCLFTIPFTINPPAEPLVSVDISPVSCFGLNDASIDVTQIGEGPYEYFWTGPNGFSSSNQDIEFLYSGDYFLQVTNTENFCVFNDIISVVEPEVLTIFGSTTDYSGFGVTCFGATDGSIDMTVIGGTEPYNIVWDDGFITEDVDNLGVGTYAVEVIDSNGCSVNTTFIITEPPNSLSISELHSDYGGFGVSCSGGTDGFIDITVNGGVSPYQYEWSNGSNDEDLLNISAGDFSVQVFDQNGCSIDLTVNITEPDAVEIFNQNIETVTCPGGNDGAINIDLNGGFPPYIYNWSSLNGFTSNNEDIDNLVSGDYSLEIIDDLGCTYNFVFNVPEQEQISIDINSQNISCFGENDGSINIIVSGGTPPFNYNWSNGANTPNINNLSPGEYTLTITDFYSCEEVVTTIIEEPDVLNFTVNTFDVSTCFGDDTGSAYLTINGGTPPYNQNWFGFNPNALQGGNYNVTVTDFNGCEFSSAFVINEPEELILDITTEDVLSCYGDASGNAEINISGGAPPYNVNTDNVIDLNSIPAGNYTFSVVDSNGCEVFENFEITQPLLLQITVDVTNPFCPLDNSGQATVNISGGTGPYSQIWNDMNGNPVNPNTLYAGQYEVIIIDQFNCEASQIFNVYDPEIEPIFLFVPPDLFCLEEFSASSSGGFGDGVWSFSGPGNIIFGNPNSQITTVQCSDYGEYELIYTDECGLQSTISFEMNPSPPQIANIPDVFCEFSTFLFLVNDSGEDGFWSVVSTPNDESAEFDDINSINPIVTVSNYGTYTFMYTSCGSYDEVIVDFRKNPYANFAVTYYDCVQNSSVFADIPDNIDNGYFEFIDGPGNVIIDNETPNTIDFTVDSWGMYDFAYHLCDTVANFSVGFSCPITVPNSLSPNGDGNNDYFSIQGLDPELHKNLVFTVYNRWGYVVHAQNGFSSDKVLWDGRINDLNNEIVSDGVYYFVLDLFNEASQTKETYQGNIYISKDNYD